jgi:hypothetical protein
MAADAEDFAAGVRAWLSRHRPPPGLRWTQWTDPDSPELCKWAQALRQAGYLCATWPREYGGGGLSPLQAALVATEFAHADVPLVNRGPAEWMVGPALLACGTQEQKRRFLPRIVDGSDVYCQGFSEPDAGSDLAALRTRGAIEDHELVVTGQKIWTTGAHRANMMFCLCRTDPESARHRGLSFVLLDVHRPDGTPNGITFRPIRDMTGGRHFNETFLDGARAPLSNIIGGMNNGWAVTTTTLGYERAHGALTAHLAHRKRLWDAVAMARETGRINDPQVRQDLAWAFTQIEIMSYLGADQLGRLVTGEGPGSASSVNKMHTSRYLQRFGEIVIGIRGAAAMVLPDQPGNTFAPDEWQRTYLFNRSTTIAGGTAEIQRNTVAERVLGLPKG